MNIDKNKVVSALKVILCFIFGGGIGLLFIFEVLALKIFLFIITVSVVIGLISKTEQMLFHVWLFSCGWIPVLALLFLGDLENTHSVVNIVGLIISTIFLPFVVWYIKGLFIKTN